MLCSSFTPPTLISFAQRCLWRAEKAHERERKGLDGLRSRNAPTVCFPLRYHIQRCVNLAKRSERYRWRFAGDVYSTHERWRQTQWETPRGEDLGEEAVDAAMRLSADQNVGVR